MPTCLEHWAAMPPTTCYGYKRRYLDVESIKKQIIIHGKSAGVIISDDNDGPGLLLDDFIKASPKQVSRKRRRIQAQPVAVVIQMPDVNDNTEQPIAQSQVPMQEATQLMNQVQPLVHTAEQPMEQALVRADEQPMEQALVRADDAAPVPMVQAQAQQPIIDVAPVPSVISLPHCTNTPIFNGAHKPLVLNGLVIEVDPVTFMVNATQMCRAAGKLFGNYWQLDSTKKYLQGLSLDIGIPISKLVQRNQSGRGLSQDTNVHFLVALHLAYWLSTEVQVQFSKWIGELLLTGRVQLGNEMNVQQLEEIWRRKVQEGQDRASADLSAEQDRCQEIILQRNELELQLATIQEAHQRSDEENKALVAIKEREDLEAAIQFQVNTTAPTIATYKEGDNVLYLARIDETKFKYGHTKNLKQRLEAHGRRGVYPTLELVWIVKSNNGVASEDQLHAYVKKKKIIVEYGTQREIISLKSVDDLERMLKKMNKCALPRANADIGMRRLDIKIRKIEANAEVKINKIKASLEMKMMQMLEEKTITFEQYMQIKNT